MTGAGIQLDSLRFSSLESRRLAWVFALSLLVHLLAWGGYEVGQGIQPVAKAAPAAVDALHKNKTGATSASAERAHEFVDVNPAQATTEAPKNAKYYSNQNSHAANPEANRDAKRRN